MGDSPGSTMARANGSALAKPLHIQRLEACLDMTMFMEYARNLLSQPLSSDESSDSDENLQDIVFKERNKNDITTSKEDHRSDKLNVYNFSQVGPDRKWLQEILLSDTDTESEISDEEEYLKNLLKQHQLEKKIRSNYSKKASNAQYGYYSTGLLSQYDYYPEHKRSIVGVRKRKKEKERKTEKPEKRKYKKNGKNAKQNNSDKDGEGSFGDGDNDEKLLLGDNDDENINDKSRQSPSLIGSSKRLRKKALASKTPEMMAIRRKKIWQVMAKKEMNKVQRAKANNHKEMLTNCKKVAGFCVKICRQKAMQSQKNMKETIWRAKRLTREMQGYWKRYDRVERETRRRMEKEAEEKRKMDVEIIEAKRQQRKLNFLITQTELYAHFMSKKLGKGTEEEQIRILNQLDEDLNPRLAAIDDYDSELIKIRAQKNATEAFDQERLRTLEFDKHRDVNLVPIEPKKKDGDGSPEEYPQPSMFTGLLKGYQLKGMTWLANLFDQGISGILADEMGLGKTVQSIAFLCHIAEKYGVWGPFLIISPASTLHNWQQEMQRFVPDFKVVPYWGSPNERRVLRQFWDQKDLHKKEASFHVVITSYQLIVADHKYFNRIKWQYMVLDEAQAIKSSSSVRWKLLLGFNCRNRLLLSGTPIQNSMAELWALLHFIMPTLFDSHEEFNEWFSKDIESHAENKTGIDEKQISRLHMILKPFMLRRIKKDVENELSDKIEIMMYCPLTIRQKLLYMALKKKIRIEDLLHYSDRGSDCVDKNFTSNLMNLVMQFRKVCNHPELFERRDAKSPFAMKCTEYVIPRLLFDEALFHRSFPSKRHLIYNNRFCIFKAENVQRSLFPRFKTDRTVRYCNYVDLNLDSTFSFTRFIDISPDELEKLALEGLIYKIQHYKKIDQQLQRLNYRWLCWAVSYWGKNTINTMFLEPSFERYANQVFVSRYSVMDKLLFTTTTMASYIHLDHSIHSMPESMEHRTWRSKCVENESDNVVKITSEELTDFESPTTSQASKPAVKSPTKSPISKGDSQKSSETITLLPEFPFIERPSKVIVGQLTDMPTYLYGLGPKVQCNGRKQYVESRAAQWTAIRHEQCENNEGLQLVETGIDLCYPHLGWSNIIIPDKQTLITDAGKLFVLDGLLTRLKSQGHRVLIYSQMTRVIDLLEEYMWHRKHRYMRLDGSSKISARRDMVADFQNRSDIFVFLLSTRAGGLGINLTAADTVIFYDSDWNPTVDQQAMDRAHRLGQTKQVTVYRLICKGTIEERILQRAREKSEIQRMVISGGNFKPDTLKPKEVVSLLLDDEEIKLKYRQRTEENVKSTNEDSTTNRSDRDKDRKRKAAGDASTSETANPQVKKTKITDVVASTSTAGLNDDTLLAGNSGLFESSGAPSPPMSDTSHGSGRLPADLVGHDDSSNEALVVDYDSPNSSSTGNFSSMNLLGKSRRRQNPRGSGRRGRPPSNRRGPPGRMEDAESGTPPSAHSQSSAYTPTKRGPGRPRLKPSGPGNIGFRTKSRIRKPVGPLVVPLGSSPAPTPTVRSPAMSPAHSSSHPLGHKYGSDEHIDVAN